MSNSSKYMYKQKKSSLLKNELFTPFENHTAKCVFKKWVVRLVANDFRYVLVRRISNRRNMFERSNLICISSTPDVDAPV